MQRDGKWKSLWRVVGRYANVSIFDVESNDELHTLLASLPLFPYMDIQVTALARHPRPSEAKPPCPTSSRPSTSPATRPCASSSAPRTWNTWTPTRACCWPAAPLQDDGADAGGGLYLVDLDTREAAAVHRRRSFAQAGLFERVAITRWRKAYVDGVCHL